MLHLIGDCSFFSTLCPFHLQVYCHLQVVDDSEIDDCQGHRGKQSFQKLAEGHCFLVALSKSSGAVYGVKSSYTQDNIS